MTLLGVFLAGIPFVRNNIDTVTILILLVSVVPTIIGVIRRGRTARTRQEYGQHRARCA